jgi:hypothetical protein
VILNSYWQAGDALWGLWRSGNLGKIGFLVSNWTLFSLKTPECPITVGFLGLSKKGPLSVRISNRRNTFIKTVAPNFATESTAVDLEAQAASCLFELN